MAPSRDSSRLLLGLEFIFLVTTLSLSLYGYPDELRETLWQEGAIRHYNSDPSKRIYYYANHLEPPPIPFTWSKSFTILTLTAPVIAFTILTTRILLHLLGAKAQSTRTSVFLRLATLPFWAVSFIAQLSSDHSDPSHDASFPWYLIHACFNEDREGMRIAGGSGMGGAGGGGAGANLHDQWAAVNGTKMGMGVGVGNPSGRAATGAGVSECIVARSLFGMTILGMGIWTALVWVGVAALGVECLLRKGKHGGVGEKEKHSVEGREWKFWQWSIRNDKKGVYGEVTNYDSDVEDEGLLSRRRGEV
ncbi:hypothetical protein BGZ60DRAFT_528202 [Tricladium varicosporioides]|nr:hypothetical protein BGZ60DRAFT_528202 [Hymenoscyphus varicosporioides]